jgi:hypothetical protein
MIIKFEPSLHHSILANSCIVATPQAPIVITHSVQVVLTLARTLSYQCKVIYWKLDLGRYLLVRCCEEGALLMLESLQVNNKDFGARIDFCTLCGDLMRLTLGTVPFLIFLKHFLLLKSLQAVIQCYFLGCLR